MALWTRNAATSGVRKAVRLIEQPERQTVRRANIWTCHATTTVSAGDTFRITRGQVITTWRVMYTDPAETALQRSYCHLQLSDTCSIQRRSKAKQASGSAELNPSSVTSSVRCQWVESSAEIDVQAQRRKLASEFYLVVQTVPDISVFDTIKDSSGRDYRVERIEHPFNRVDLPYLICSRSDV